MKSFYEVLQLPSNVTTDDLQARFRELARDEHPDRFSGEAKKRAELRFQEITEAFNVLRDPKRRREHDQDLERPTRQGRDPAQEARVFLARGIKAFKVNNFIEAADNFDRATKAEPSNHQTWHHLALTCYQEERWTEKAQEAIERALELRANHPPYVKLAARIYVKAKMTAKAKEYYNLLIRLGGSDATVRKALEAGGPARSRASAAATDKGQEKEKSGLFGKLF